MSEHKEKLGCCSATAGLSGEQAEATVRRSKMNDIHKKHEAWPTPKIVSHDEWIKQRRELNEDEKQLTRLRDQVTKKRLALPWTQVNDYVFDHVDCNGKASQVRLSELFGERGELIVYHFMYPGPDGVNPCAGCSCWCDGFNGVLPHITARAAFAAIAKESAVDLAALVARKNWQFRMFSAAGNNFQRDFALEPSEEERKAGAVKDYNFGAGSPQFLKQYPGLSVFHIDRETKTMYRTYTSMARGL